MIACATSLLSLDLMHGAQSALVLRRLLVCDAPTAARQMLRAIFRNQQHAYITKRYALIAFVLKLRAPEADGAWSRPQADTKTVGSQRQIDIIGLAVVCARYSRMR